MSGVSGDPAHGPHDQGHCQRREDRHDTPPCRRTRRRPVCPPIPSSCGWDRPTSGRPALERAYVTSVARIGIRLLRPRSRARAAAGPGSTRAAPSSWRPPLICAPSPDGASRSSATGRGDGLRPSPTRRTMTAATTARSRSVARPAGLRDALAVGLWIRRGEGRRLPTPPHRPSAGSQARAHRIAGAPRDREALITTLPATASAMEPTPTRTSAMQGRRIRGSGVA